MFNLSLVHHCLISPYQISVYEPTCDTNQGGCKEAATEFQQDPDCGRLRSLF